MYAPVWLVSAVICHVIKEVSMGYNKQPVYYGQNPLKVVTIELLPHMMYTEQGRYEGYIKDVLDLILADMKVRYELYRVRDGQYGSYIYGRWNGMIKDLLDRKADIAAAPLQKTYGRAQVVDFTRSILNYTATMLVLNDVATDSAPIHSIQDVLADPDIQIGTLQYSFIVHEFERTPNPLYRKLWDTTNKHLTKSNKEGIGRVKNSRGKYVYILPSDIADYNAGDEPCDLRVVGSFFHREYVFAVEKDSPLLPLINQAIFKLEQSGKFRELYNKWWHLNRKCSHDWLHPSQLTANGTVYNVFKQQYIIAILILNLLKNVYIN